MILFFVLNDYNFLFIGPYYCILYHIYKCHVYLDHIVFVNVKLYVLNMYFEHI